MKYDEIVFVGVWSWDLCPKMSRVKNVTVPAFSISALETEWGTCWSGKLAAYCIYMYLDLEDLEAASVSVYEWWLIMNSPVTGELTWLMNFAHIQNSTKQRTIPRNAQVCGVRAHRTSKDIKNCKDIPYVSICDILQNCAKHYSTSKSAKRKHASDRERRIPVSKN